MRFKTKKELLEHLGKNVNDRKLVDRMMSKGEVVMVDWEYEYNTPAEDFSEREKELMEKIEWLEFTLDLKESQIEGLRWEIEELKKTPAVQVEKNVAYTTNEVSDSELLWHLEYLYDMVEKKNSFIAEVVQQFFNKNRMSYDYDWAREECYKIFKYVEDLNEQDELEYVKDIIWKRW